jgi:hypothetical protein
MEKGDFEKEWSNAFEGTEVSPSDAVWTNIELDLERAAGGKMKKRILFYKMLAAASLVFAMGIGGVYYLQSPPETDNSIARQEPSGIQNAETPNSENKTGSQTEASIEFQEAPTLSGSSDPSALPDNPQANTNTVNTDKLDRGAFEKKGSINATNQQVKTLVDDQRNDAVNNQKLLALINTESVGDQASVNTDEEKVFEEKNNTLNYRKLPPLTSLKNPELVIAKKESESTADPGMVLLAKLKDEEKKYAEEDKKKSKREELWTSVGFGAGTFNPNSNVGSMVQYSNGLSSSSNNFSTDQSAGSSYSFGVQVGGRITNRLVLQGGISYLTQNASYISNIASMESASLRASLNDLASVSYHAVTTSPYTVNSNLQYISVPTQLGYVLVDRKFAIQVNGGVATDIFIVNTLTPETDNVSKVSQGPGEDSPFRPVLFSGLVGTEFSYRFSDRYRIAVNPGFRYALNSIYKAEVSAEASPITYDVSLRFRYIFK